MKQNFRILAYLNPNEKGCNYSKHFTDHFINNDKLHPFVKKIPVELTNVTAIQPRVELHVNGNIVWKKFGNNINPATLQEFILDQYNKG